MTAYNRGQVLYRIAEMMEDTAAFYDVEAASEVRHLHDVAMGEFDVANAQFPCLAHAIGQTG